jgi:DNA-binding NarL/FixJ family response regulator
VTCQSSKRLSGQFRDFLIVRLRSFWDSSSNFQYPSIGDSRDLGHASRPVGRLSIPFTAKDTDTTVKPIRVLLADDHTLIRAGISALLERTEGIKVVGEAADGINAMNLIQELAPDLVLLDLQMPGLSGFEVMHRATRKFPEIKIIVLSVHNTEEHAMRSLHAGASGYLPKSAASTELELAIGKVMRGEQYLSPTITKTTSSEPTTVGHTGKAASVELTPRQREVLVLVAEGYSTRGIARNLGISVKTVETHRAQLMERLGIHDVASLVRYAIRAGIIQLGD